MAIGAHFYAHKGTHDRPWCRGGGGCRNIERRTQARSIGALNDDDSKSLDDGGGAHFPVCARPTAERQAGIATSREWSTLDTTRTERERERDSARTMTKSALSPAQRHCSGAHAPSLLRVPTGNHMTTTAQQQQQQQHFGAPISHRPRVALPAGFRPTKALLQWWWYRQQPPWNYVRQESDNDRIKNTAW